MNRKSVKIIAVVFIAALLAVCLCACGHLDFTYRQNSDGTYAHIIDITLDGDFADTGYNVSTAVDALISGFTEKGYKVSYDIDAKRFTATKTFADLTALHNDLIDNGLYVDREKVEQKTNGFMDYETINATPKLSGGNFAAIKSTIKYTLYDGGLSLGDAEKVADAMLGFNCSYTFETPLNSIKTDADTVTKNDDGYYVHTWNFDTDENIKITLTTVKGSVWYAVAVIAAAAIPLIMAVIKIAKAKRGNKKVAAAAQGGDYGGEN